MSESGGSLAMYCRPLSKLFSTIDRPFVLELPPEAAMVVLEHTRTHLLKPGDSLGRQSENTRAFFSRGGTFEARSRPDCYAQRDK